jgi:small subunit ribosomal protein S4
MPIKGPKVKVSRALNLALTPKAARVMERRAFPPGQHGMGRKRSPSVYKQQLVEKQRLKFSYNVSEKQLRKAYDKAAAASGTTGEILLQLLERRLDTLVQRMGFAKTAYAARQYCAHGHFEVNGKRAWTGSMLLKVGDVVAVRERSKGHGQIKESLEAAAPVAYVEVEKNKMVGKLIAIPNRDEIPVPVNEQLVIEFYSR